MGGGFTFVAGRQTLGRRRARPQTEPRPSTARVTSCSPLCRCRPPRRRTAMPAACSRPH